MSKEGQLEKEVAQIVASATPKKKRAPRKKAGPSISQTAIGDRNIQVGGDAIITQKVVRPVVAEVKPGAETFHKLSTTELSDEELQRAYSWVATQKRKS